ncbi:hypothetical protein D7X55_16475 [Corallococcus sp. AB049A]|uniref:hypothetical protein n=1 Tax=Corallococcus sp. AB049A TaxID=2316721 RepID=UPI000EC90EF8|nr:hypothetical protein [Corallococcus sp. AB049A]RKI65395.1 hypothetical protein D7X55_16475 [Corallococcus sp. AB049A]
MLLDPPIPVLLPHGLFDEDGRCHRQGELRALTGREEWSLAQAGERPGPRAVSELLAACLARLGDYPRVDASLAACLTRGDRHHLALHLRARLYGDRLTLVARCPAPGCEAVADVDVRLSALSPERPLDAPEVLTVALPEGTAEVREPTGEDDAVLADAQGSRAERAALLWSRLVVVDGRALTPSSWLGLPARSRHAVALALADGTSAPDLGLLARCPKCSAWLELELDPFALLTRELRGGAARLETEVHVLAFHYHWSEADILALPRARRWRYLELLRNELEGRPLVDGWS